MEYTGRSAMKEIVELNHGDLKEFAVVVKGKLTRTGSPNEADFIDAIYEAALSLQDPPEEDEASAD